MTNKTTRGSKINLKFCAAILSSLFIVTQCARDEAGSGQRRAAAATSPQEIYQQQQYRGQYSPNYGSYYGQPNARVRPGSSYVAPNSRAYSNPYDFSPPHGNSPNKDNDQVYELPNEYMLR